MSRVHCTLPVPTETVNPNKHVRESTCWVFVKRWDQDGEKMLPGALTTEELEICPREKLHKTGKNQLCQ
jgi:hypothetical protein